MIGIWVLLLPFTTVSRWTYHTNLIKRLSLTEDDYRKLLIDLNLYSNEELNLRIKKMTNGPEIYWEYLEIEEDFYSYLLLKYEND